MDKKISFILLVLLGLSNINHVFAQGSSCRITADDWHHLQVEFNTGALGLVNMTVEGQTFATIDLADYLPSSVEGAPCLPIFSRLIEVPACNGYDVLVSGEEFDTIDLKGILMMPTQPSRSKSDTTHHPLVFNKKLYATDAFYGHATAEVEYVGIARDRRMALLQFSPVRYNPVSGKLIVCRHAVVEVRYIGADKGASLEWFNRYFSPHFASGALVMNSLYPKAVNTAAPIRYLIVAHSSFQGQLDTFVQWKRRKGFITDIVYTNNPAVGTTTTSIASYIQSQFTGATATNPAPTYLLIVGDHEQIPAFTGTTDDDHITDLYYISWTSGDNIPDCYSGRFSAQNVSQLTPQVQKTLMYEQYTFADPSFLDRAVLVAGVDGGSSGDFGYTHADPAMDYAATHYINSTQGFTQVEYFKNNTSIVPSATGVTIGSSASSNSATVRSYYNQGAGWINYSAHGSATSWGTPNFTTTHVGQMTNTQKFGLMIGNCCLTNKFETTTCFGESLLRKGNYCGAVGYIGGSNSTYWNEDFYWAVGLRSGISASMSMAYNANNLGAYDRLCHTHNEPHNQWAMSQASIMMVGNMAVESSTSSRKLYYWEIYHLMGDPSVMPYLTQASVANLAAPTLLVAGSQELAVQTVPYAYVALTGSANHELMAAAWADETGNATLSLPSSLAVGEYELAASAQQYRTAFANVSVVQPDGAFPIVLQASSQDPLQAGMQSPIFLMVGNPGSMTAHNVGLLLTVSDSTLMSLNTTTIAIDSLLPDDTLMVGLIADIAADAQDGQAIAITSEVTCSDTGRINAALHTFVIDAPVINMDLSTSSLNILPGGTATIQVGVSNSGHAPLTDDRVTLTTATRLLSTGDGSSSATSDLFTLQPDNQTTISFTLHADTALPTGISVPITLNSQRQTLLSQIYVGVNPEETFEGNSYHLSGWSQGNYPWSIVNSGAQGGTYCLRSNSSLTHNQTSQINISVSLSSADSIVFYCKVSSEANYDKFHFLIDNNELLTLSGQTDWSRQAFLVQAGNHTLSFTYSKDGSVDRYDDCAWIDDIMLPHETQNASFQHLDFCTGDDYSLQSESLNTSTPGEYTQISTTATGGLLLTDYTVHQSYAIEFDTAVCDGMMWLDSIYEADTWLNHLFSSIWGCDSLVNFHLTVHHSTADTLTITVNDSLFVWNDSTYTYSGIYTLLLTTQYGCDSSLTLVLNLADSSSTGIGQVPPATPVRVYPNPTDGIIHLSQEVPEAVLFDLRGRALQRRRNVRSMDITTLPNGIYILRTQSEVQAIIKN